MTDIIESVAGNPNQSALVENSEGGLGIEAIPTTLEERRKEELRLKETSGGHLIQPSKEALQERAGIRG